MREIKQKRKAAKKEKTMDELLSDAKKAQEALEDTLKEVGAGEKARIVAGGKKNELIRKQFEVEQQKKREKLKKLIDAVTNSRG